MSSVTFDLSQPSDVESDSVSTEGSQNLTGAEALLLCTIPSSARAFCANIMPRHRQRLLEVTKTVTVTELVTQSPGLHPRTCEITVTNVEPDPHPVSVIISHHHEKLMTEEEEGSSSGEGMDPSLVVTESYADTSRRSGYEEEITTTTTTELIERIDDADLTFNDRKDNVVNIHFAQQKAQHEYSSKETDPSSRILHFHNFDSHEHYQRIEQEMMSPTDSAIYSSSQKRNSDSGSWYGSDGSLVIHSSPENSKTRRKKSASTSSEPESRTVLERMVPTRRSKTRRSKRSRPHSYIITSMSETRSSGNSPNTTTIHTDLDSSYRSRQIYSCSDVSETVSPTPKVPPRIRRKQVIGHSTSVEATIDDEQMNNDFNITVDITGPLHPSPENLRDVDKTLYVVEGQNVSVEMVFIPPSPQQDGSTSKAHWQLVDDCIEPPLFTSTPMNTMERKKSTESKINVLSPKPVAPPRKGSKPSNLPNIVLTAADSRNRLSSPSPRRSPSSPIIVVNQSRSRKNSTDILDETPRRRKSTVTDIDWFAAFQMKDPNTPRSPRADEVMKDIEANIRKQSHRMEKKETPEENPACCIAMDDGFDISGTEKKECQCSACKARKSEKDTQRHANKLVGYTVSETQVAKEPPNDWVNSDVSVEDIFSFESRALKVEEIYEQVNSDDESDNRPGKDINTRMDLAKETTKISSQEHLKLSISQEEANDLDSSEKSSRKEERSSTTDSTPLESKEDADVISITDNANVEERKTVTAPAPAEAANARKMSETVSETSSAKTTRSIPEHPIRLIESLEEGKQPQKKECNAFDQDTQQADILRNNVKMTKNTATIEDTISVEKRKEEVPRNEKLNVQEMFVEAVSEDVSTNTVRQSDISQEPQVKEIAIREAVNQYTEKVNGTEQLNDYVSELVNESIEDANVQLKHDIHENEIEIGIDENLWERNCEEIFRCSTTENKHCKCSACRSKNTGSELTNITTFIKPHIIEEEATTQQTIKPLPLSDISMEDVFSPPSTSNVEVKNSPETEKEVDKPRHTVETTTVYFPAREESRKSSTAALPTSDISMEDVFSPPSTSTVEVKSLPETEKEDVKLRHTVETTTVYLPARAEPRKSSTAVLPTSDVSIDDVFSPPSTSTVEVKSLPETEKEDVKPRHTMETTTVYLPARAEPRKSSTAALPTFDISMNDVFSPPSTSTVEVKSLPETEKEDDKPRHTVETTTVYLPAREEPRKSSTAALPTSDISMDNVFSPPSTSTVEVKSLPETEKEDDKPRHTVETTTVYLPREEPRKSSTAVLPTSDISMDDVFSPPSTSTVEVKSLPETEKKDDKPRHTVETTTVYLPAREEPRKSSTAALPTSDISMDDVFSPPSTSTVGVKSLPKTEKEDVKLRHTVETTTVYLPARAEPRKSSTAVLPTSDVSIDDVFSPPSTSTVEVKSLPETEKEDVKPRHTMETTTVYLPARAEPRKSSTAALPTFDISMNDVFSPPSTSTVEVKSLPETEKEDDKPRHTVETTTVYLPAREEPRKSSTAALPTSDISMDNVFSPPSTSTVEVKSLPETEKEDDKPRHTVETTTVYLPREEPRKSSTAVLPTSDISMDDVFSPPSTSTVEVKSLPETEKKDDKPRHTVETTTVYLPAREEPRKSSTAALPTSDISMDDVFSPPSTSTVGVKSLPKTEKEDVKPRHTMETTTVYLPARAEPRKSSTADLPTFDISMDDFFSPPSTSTVEVKSLPETEKEDDKPRHTVETTTVYLPAREEPRKSSTAALSTSDISMDDVFSPPSTSTVEVKSLPETEKEDDKPRHTVETTTVYLPAREEPRKSSTAVLPTSDISMDDVFSPPSTSTVKVKSLPETEKEDDKPRHTVETTTVYLPAREEPRKSSTAALPTSDISMDDVFSPPSTSTVEVKSLPETEKEDDKPRHTVETTNVYLPAREEPRKSSTAALPTTDISMDDVFLPPSTSTVEVKSLPETEKEDDKPRHTVETTTVYLPAREEPRKSSTAALPTSDISMDDVFSPPSTSTVEVKSLPETEKEDDKPRHTVKTTTVYLPAREEPRKSSTAALPTSDISMDDVFSPPSTSTVEVKSLPETEKEDDKPRHTVETTTVYLPAREEPRKSSTAALPTSDISMDDVFSPPSTSTVEVKSLPETEKEDDKPRHTVKTTTVYLPAREEPRKSSTAALPTSDISMDDVFSPPSTSTVEVKSLPETEKENDKPRHTVEITTVYLPAREEPRKSSTAALPTSDISMDEVFSPPSTSTVEVKSLPETEKEDDKPRHTVETTTVYLPAREEPRKSSTAALPTSDISMDDVFSPPSTSTVEVKSLPETEKEDDKPRHTVETTTVYLPAREEPRKSSTAALPTSDISMDDVFSPPSTSTVEVKSLPETEKEDDKLRHTVETTTVYLPAREEPRKSSTAALPTSDISMDDVFSPPSTSTVEVKSLPETEKEDDKPRHTVETTTVYLPAREEPRKSSTAALPTSDISMDDVFSPPSTSTVEVKSLPETEKEDDKPRHTVETTTVYLPAREEPRKSSTAGLPTSDISMDDVFSPPSTSTVEVKSLPETEKEDDKPRHTVETTTVYLPAREEPRKSSTAGLPTSDISMDDVFSPPSTSTVEVKNLPETEKENDKPRHTVETTTVYLPAREEPRKSSTAVLPTSDISMDDVFSPPSTSTVKVKSLPETEKEDDKPRHTVETTTVYLPAREEPRKSSTAALPTSDISMDDVFSPPSTSTVKVKSLPETEKEDDKPRHTVETTNVYLPAREEPRKSSTAALPTSDISMDDVFSPPPTSTVEVKSLPETEKEDDKLRQTVKTTTVYLPAREEPRKSSTAALPTSDISMDDVFSPPSTSTVKVKSLPETEKEDDKPRHTVETTNVYLPAREEPRKSSTAALPTSDVSMDDVFSPPPTSTVEVKSLPETEKEDDKLRQTVKTTTVYLPAREEPRKSSTAGLPTSDISMDDVFSPPSTSTVEVKSLPETEKEDDKLRQTVKTTTVYLPAREEPRKSSTAGLPTSDISMDDVFSPPSTSTVEVKSLPETEKEDDKLRQTVETTTVYLPAREEPRKSSTAALPTSDISMDDVFSPPSTSTVEVKSLPETEKEDDKLRHTVETTTVYLPAREEPRKSSTAALPTSDISMDDVFSPPSTSTVEVKSLPETEKEDDKLRHTVETTTVYLPAREEPRKSSTAGLPTSDISMDDVFSPPSTSTVEVKSLPETEKEDDKLRHTVETTTVYLPAREEPRKSSTAGLPTSDISMDDVFSPPSTSTVEVKSLPETEKEDDKLRQTVKTTNVYLPAREEPRKSSTAALPTSDISMDDVFSPPSTSTVEVKNLPETEKENDKPRHTVETTTVYLPAREEPRKSSTAVLPTSDISMDDVFSPPSTSTVKVKSLPETEKEDDKPRHTVETTTVYLPAREEPRKSSTAALPTSDISMDDVFSPPSTSTVKVKSLPETEKEDDKPRHTVETTNVYLPAREEPRKSSTAALPTSDISMDDVFSPPPTSTVEVKSLPETEKEDDKLRQTVKTTTVYLPAREEPRKSSTAGLPTSDISMDDVFSPPSTSTVEVKSLPETEKEDDKLRQTVKTTTVYLPAREEPRKSSTAGLPTSDISMDDVFSPPSTSTVEVKSLPETEKEDDKLRQTVETTTVYLPAREEPRKSSTAALPTSDISMDDVFSPPSTSTVEVKSLPETEKEDDKLRQTVETTTVYLPAREEPRKSSTAALHTSDISMDDVFSPPSTSTVEVKSLPETEKEDDKLRHTVETTTVYLPAREEPRKSSTAALPTSDISMDDVFSPPSTSTVEVKSLPETEKEDDKPRHTEKEDDKPRHTVETTTVYLPAREEPRKSSTAALPTSDISMDDVFSPPSTSTVEVKSLPETEKEDDKPRHIVETTTVYLPAREEPVKSSTAALPTSDISMDDVFSPPSTSTVEVKSLPETEKEDDKPRHTVETTTVYLPAREEPRKSSTAALPTSDISMNDVFSPPSTSTVEVKSLPETEKEDVKLRHTVETTTVYLLAREEPRKSSTAALPTSDISMDDVFSPPSTSTVEVKSLPETEKEDDKPRHTVETTTVYLPAREEPRKSSTAALPTSDISMDDVFSPPSTSTVEVKSLPETEKEDVKLRHTVETTTVYLLAREEPRKSSTAALPTSDISIDDDIENNSVKLRENSKRYNREDARTFSTTAKISSVLYEYPIDFSDLNVDTKEVDDSKRISVISTAHFIMSSPTSSNDSNEEIPSSDDLLERVFVNTQKTHTEEKKCSCTACGIALLSETELLILRQRWRQERTVKQSMMVDNLTESEQNQLASKFRESDISIDEIFSPTVDSKPNLIDERPSGNDLTIEKKTKSTVSSKRMDFYAHDLGTPPTSPVIRRHYDDFYDEPNYCTEDLDVVDMVDNILSQSLDEAAFISSHKLASFKNLSGSTDTSFDRKRTKPVESTTNPTVIADNVERKIEQRNTAVDSMPASSINVEEHKGSNGFLPSSSVTMNSQSSQDDYVVRLVFSDSPKISVINDPEPSPVPERKVIDLNMVSNTDFRIVKEPTRSLKDEEMLEVEVDSHHFVIKGSYSIVIEKTEPLGELLSSMHSDDIRSSEFDFTVTSKLRRILMECLKEKAQGNAESSLSPRARTLVDSNDTASQVYDEMVSNKYSLKNPTGNVNFCTAENNICTDMMLERFSKEPDLFRPENEHLFHYARAGGHLSVIESLTEYVNKTFNSHVESSSICLAPSGNAAYDMICYCLFEKDDVLLTNCPSYSRNFINVADKAQCQLHPVYLDLKNPRIDIEAYQRELEAHKEKDEVVRGVVLMNPDNPLGIIYPKKDVISLCNWAASNNIYVLIDEIFAQCVYDEDKFVSVLSFLHELEHPEKVVWFWSPTKDYGIPGLKLCIMHTKDRELQSALSRIEKIQPISSLAQDFAVKLVKNQDEWLAKFHSTKNIRLKATYDYVAENLQLLELPFIKATAGIFVLVDFRKYMTSSSFEYEFDVWRRLADAGVFLTTGADMKAGEPGWMRLVFACTKEEVIEGMRRISKTLTGTDETVGTISY